MGEANWIREPRHGDLWTRMFHVLDDSSEL